MVKKSETETLSVALSVEDITELEYVDQQKFYFVDLQFGSKASWRDWQGQPRIVAPLAGGGFSHTHNPKVEHGLGPFPGKIVNGLISSHNDWLKKHRRRKDNDYAGQVDRQMIVLKTEETEKLPASLAADGVVPISMIERLVESAVQEQMSALTGG